MLQGIAKAKKQSGDIFNVIVIGDGQDKNYLLNQSANLGIDKNVFLLVKYPIR